MVLLRKDCAWTGALSPCSFGVYVLVYTDLSTSVQGWRLEVKGYPRLTEHGAWRGREGSSYGGFYSQDQVSLVGKARPRQPCWLNLVV